MLLDDILEIVNLAVGSGLIEEGIRNESLHNVSHTFRILGKYMIRLFNH